MVLFGHKRLRPVPLAVDVVQAVLGGLGRAAGRYGKAPLAARRRTSSKVATPLGAPAIHTPYGRRGRNGNYSDAELATWKRRIAAWRSRTEVFAYLNNDWEAFAPRNAMKLL